ncbi:MAG: helix-turn-helix domain-containing protein [Bacteroidales bacterium]|nr:helix-turn-helix domain-containing protein [Bacteroidales bacterium]
MNAPASVIFTLFLAACASGPQQAAGGMPAAGADQVRIMSVERLPDLNIPRNTHIAAFVGGELTVIGGHSTGFVPTSTAEYYRDGAWHLVDSYFPHDFGFGVTLPTEEVLVGGGCAEPFGIGQTFGIEIYSPETHSFTPLPIMDRKRTKASAALLYDGTVVISGNWYEEDFISTYSVSGGPSSSRPSVWQRTQPLILQTAPDNAIILSCVGTRDEKLPPIAERLRGEPFEIPLLQDWDLWVLPDGCRMDSMFIGDETVGGYAWLFPAIRKADGQPGIIKVVGDDFSVLETERPILTERPEGETLGRPVYLLSDRGNSCAWLLQSVTDQSTIYVTRIDYGAALRGGKAPRTIYRADLPEGVLAPWEMNPVLLPGGRIAILGGRTGPDEYFPTASAFILHTTPLESRAGFSWWWLAAGFVLSGVCLILIINRFNKKPSRSAEQDAAVFTDMMTRIQRLMEEKELYKNPDLKVADLAAELGTNAAYVRGCIAGVYGGTFGDFVGEYRVRHIQRLLLKNPDAKITSLAEEAGFSSNATFYRRFTALTGLSPAAWLKQQQNK